MAKGKFAKEYAIPSDSPLRAEHEAVKRWVADALAKLGEWKYYENLDLRKLRSGQVIWDADAEQARRYLMAAVEQVSFWDKEADRIYARNPQQGEHPGWPTVWGSRRQAQNVIMPLMKRSLPLQRLDFLQILGWIQEREENNCPLLAPLVATTRALERFAKKNVLDADLIAAAYKFVRTLRSAEEKRVRVLGTTVEQLCVPLPA